MMKGMIDNIVKHAIKDCDQPAEKLASYMADHLAKVTNLTDKQSDDLEQCVGKVVGSAKGCSKQGVNPKHDEAFMSAVSELKKVQGNIDKLKKQREEINKPVNIKDKKELK